MVCLYELTHNEVLDIVTEVIICNTIYHLTARLCNLVLIVMKEIAMKLVDFDNFIETVFNDRF